MTETKKFCPTCDTLVAVPSADTARCPQCHKSLVGDVSPAAPKRRSSLPLVAAGLAVVAGGATAWWLLRERAGLKAEATAGAANDLVLRYKSLGLSAGRANPPGVADTAMTQWARGQADAKTLLAQLQALDKPGALQQVQTTQRRRHAVLDTAELWQAAQQGKAKPIHAIERALLAKALLAARGEPVEVVVSGAGVQTPLLLSRSAYGVRVGNQVFPAGLAQPRTVSDAEAAATWLVVRANANRLARQFKLVAEDLTAAEALAPQLEAVRFVRGVSQIDQLMYDQGLATCAAALARVEDPLARLYLAEIALTQDQPVKALQRCDEALKAVPGLPEALVTKAMILLQRYPTLPADQKDKALAEISGYVEQALTSKEPPAGARVAQAQVLLAKGQNDAAESLLGAAVRDHRDLEATLLLSQLLQGKGKAEEAAQLFASAKAPLDDERVVLAWASALGMAKQLDKALEIAEQGFAAAPDSANLGLLRADLLRQTGKVSEAIAALEPLKQGADGDRVALLQAQLYMQTQDVAKATAIIAAQHAKKPSNREVTLLHVMVLALGGKADEAEPVATRALADGVLKPLEVIQAWLQTGQLPRAQKLLEAEVAKATVEIEVAGTLAVVYVAQGMKDKALAMRSEVVKKAGAKGEEFGKIIDQAIASAEAEAKMMGGAGAAGHEGHGHGDAPAPAGADAPGGAPK